MIKANIQQHFSHHKIESFVGDVFIVDYTNQDKYKKIPNSRGTNLLTKAPVDEKYLQIQNPNNLGIVGVIFDNKSFIDDVQGILNPSVRLVYSQIKVTQKAGYYLQN